MKANVSAPTAVAVIVIVAIVIVGALYMKFFHESKMSPEESKARMERGAQMQQQFKNAYQQRASGTGAAPK